MELHEALSQVTNVLKKNGMILLCAKDIDIVDLPEGLTAKNIPDGHYISVSVNVLIRDGEAKQERVSATSYSQSRNECFPAQENHSFPSE